MSRDANEILSDNVRRLMAAQGITQKELASRTGLSQSMISNLLNYRTVRKSPTLNTIQALADYWGINPWLLGIPDLSPDLALNRRVGHLVDQFVSFDESGRGLVESIAERESKYQAQHHSATHQDDAANHGSHLAARKTG